MFNLMIVDDEPLTREYMKITIPRLDSRWTVVAEAMEGTEAIELLESQRIDLIITDIKMPEMDGLELCEILSHQSNGPKLAILSGYEEFDYAKKAIKFGVKDYLLKPIKKEELKVLLNEISEQLIKENNDFLDESIISTNYDLISKTKSYIYSHFSEQLSLNQIADTLSVSVSYLSNIFHKNVGESYSKFLTRIRMEEASKLLSCNPPIKIYIVSQKVGYVSVKHFSYVFKRYYKMTPGEYQLKYLHSY